MQFFFPAVPSDLGWNNDTDEVFLLYLFGDDTGFALYPIMSKKSIVTNVYQLYHLAFTKFIFLCRLGFTMPRCNYFSIQDWVEFSKVQVNGFHLPYGWKRCKHFTWIIRGCNGKQLSQLYKLITFKGNMIHWIPRVLVKSDEKYALLLRAPQCRAQRPAERIRH